MNRRKRRSSDTKRIPPPSTPTDADVMELMSEEIRDWLKQASWTTRSMREMAERMKLDLSDVDEARNALDRLRQTEAEASGAFDLAAMQPIHRSAKAIFDTISEAAERQNSDIAEQLLNPETGQPRT